MAGVYSLRGKERPFVRLIFHSFFFFVFFDCVCYSSKKKNGKAKCTRKITVEQSKGNFTGTKKIIQMRFCFLLFFFLLCVCVYISVFL